MPITTFFGNCAKIALGRRNDKRICNSLSLATTTLSLSSPELQVLLHVQLVGHEQLDEVDDAPKVVLLVGGEGVDPVDQVGEADERALRPELKERLANGLELSRRRRCWSVLLLTGNFIWNTALYTGSP